jgi:hypothetical protein
MLGVANLRQISDMLGYRRLVGLGEEGGLPNGAYSDESG